MLRQSRARTRPFGSSSAKRSLERYLDLGLFDPNLYTVHMGYPDDREVALLAEHDVKVAHCPGASMLGAYGVISNRMMPKMAEAGVCISLGTDSATASGNLDMVRVMYLRCLRPQGRLRRRLALGSVQGAGDGDD